MVSVIRNEQKMAASQKRPADQSKERQVHCPSSPLWQTVPPLTTLQTLSIDVYLKLLAARDRAYEGILVKQVQYLLNQRAAREPDYNRE